MATTYDPDTDSGKVRLLVNDVGDPWVFQNAEIDAFLTLERGNIKRAAAQAIDTNATNEALASKVLRTQDLATDGAKVADAMRKHAAALREQADVDDELGEEFFFDLVDLNDDQLGPELTDRWT
jgi:hypothetical protein